MQLVAREVEFFAGAPPQTYHAIAQADYLAIVALTPDGRIPIVRQFRPAVERFTWELPAGMVDDGETPQECCVRELLEETGFSARAVHTLGTYAPCTARLSNQVHSFFVETGEQGQPSEPDIEMRLVTPAELGRLILSGEFQLQLHIGALLLAELRGFLD
ncbi:MAG: NUDIX hydrolase, partial [Bryobacteraceae bacterium]